MASSLAAAIENEFGIVAKLNEGHDGIYEVTINDSVVYTNRGQSGQLSTNEEILQEICKYKDPLSEEDREECVSEGVSIAPSCCLSPSTD